MACMKTLMQVIAALAVVVLASGCGASAPKPSWTAPIAPLPGFVTVRDDSRREGVQHMPKRKEATQKARFGAQGI